MDWIERLVHRMSREQGKSEEEIRERYMEDMQGRVYQARELRGLYAPATSPNEGSARRDAHENVGFDGTKSVRKFFNWPP